MRGIDVSNWQNGLNVTTLDIDFCIAKATEGVGYSDPAFDKFAQQALQRGFLFGFYHFARENPPKNEAQYFWSRVKALSGKGIPVLDYEVHNSNNRAWVESFATEYKKLSGMYPVMYCSAAMCDEFNGSWIVDKMPLWVAGYPYPATQWTQSYCPYNVHPWKSPIIWQFTSNLQLPGFNGRLDGNIAYIGELEWEMLQEGYTMSQISDMARKIDDIHNYLFDVKDVTGRGKEATMKARVNYMAAKQEKELELLEKIDAKIKK